MSDIIDFYSRFTADYIAWCQKHPEISEDDDKLEEVFPEQYQQWFSSPKKWLDGKTPNQYFEEINDAKVYASLFVSYIEQDMELPEPLIDCLVDQRQTVYPILRNILFVDGGKDISADALDEVRAKIISLIDEMQLSHPYGRYVSLLLEVKEPSDLTDALCLALEETDKPAQVRKLLLDAYPLAEGLAKECSLDLLCGFPDDDGLVCSLLAEEFRRDDIELDYIAQMAEKLGDERLLPYLKSAAADDSLDYVTHTAVRYAIEKITGEVLEDKDFTGDPVYDYLAKLDDKEDK